MLCLQCGMDRIPEIRKVKKRGKKWVIRTCRICKMQDIDEWKEIYIWDELNNKFVEDRWDATDSDED